MNLEPIEKLEALENQLDRINPATDPLRYRRQEKLIREAKSKLSAKPKTMADIARKHVKPESA